MSASRGSPGRRSVGLFGKHILRKIFLEDWLLKLTALLITVALWFGVSVSSKKGTATLDAQLTFRPPSDDMVVMNASRQEIRIVVSGDDQMIANLYGRKDLSVTANLNSENTGDLIVTLTPQNVSTNLPPNIRLDDIQPSRVAVTLESLVQKELPVQAAVIGEPAAGFEVYSITVTPTRARVSGPSSFMETLDSLPTGAVDISGAKSDVVAQQVAISVNNPRVTLSNSDIVAVTVEIGEKRVERVFSLTTAGGRRVTAVLFGPRSAITKLRTAELKAEVIRNADGVESARVILPDGATSVVEIRSVRLSGK